MVIQISTYTRICPFSNSLIRPSNFVCVFNKQQLNAFKKLIHQQLSILPSDIIELIIKKTEYEKLLYMIGHEKYVHWSVYTKKDYIVRKIIYFNFKNITDSDTDSDSDTDI